jgi:hypothetical protein
LVVVVELVVTKRFIQAVQVVAHSHKVAQSQVEQTRQAKAMSVVMQPLHTQPAVAVEQVEQVNLQVHQTLARTVAVELPHIRLGQVQPALEYQVLMPVAEHHNQERPQTVAVVLTA